MAVEYLFLQMFRIPQKMVERREPPAYDPTRKVCLSSSSDNVLGFPAPDLITTFPGLPFGGNSSPSYCAPWGNDVNANAVAASPGTAVSVKYSADATVLVSKDPLSNASKSWTLTTGVGQFWSGTFTITSCSEPQPGIAACNDQFIAYPAAFHASTPPFSTSTFVKPCA
jgi:hypothetical protein